MNFGLFFQLKCYNLSIFLNGLTHRILQIQEQRGFYLIDLLASVFEGLELGKLFYLHH